MPKLQKHKSPKRVHIMPNVCTHKAQETGPKKPKQNPKDIHEEKTKPSPLLHRQRFMPGRRPLSTNHHLQSLPFISYVPSIGEHPSTIRDFIQYHTPQTQKKKL
ncbi:hypothetical protein N665_0203s0044 [Sinapis alba]|nr:hypothetical protein N665_0203s0044 [Sinapis alba]